MKFCANFMRLIYFAFFSFSFLLFPTFIYLPSPSPHFYLPPLSSFSLLPPHHFPPLTPHPSGPWFENWGRMVAVHPALSNEDRIQITKQLLKACDPNSKQGFIPNQVLYGIRYSPSLTIECHITENIFSDTSKGVYRETFDPLDTATSKTSTTNGWH